MQKNPNFASLFIHMKESDYYCTSRTVFVAIRADLGSLDLRLFVALVDEKASHLIFATADIPR